ncbi:MAG: phosphate acyltransferase [Planctomycetota bacterium]
MPFVHASRLLSLAKSAGRPRTLAVAAAAELACLEAVVVAEAEGLVKPRLFGDRPEIERLLRSLDAAPERFAIEHVPDPTAAARRACEEIAAGRAHVLMKGLIQTGDLLRVFFDKQYGLRLDQPLSHVGLFEVPGYERLFAVSDAAINIAPDEERLFRVVQNAVGVMRRLGWERPRVALLAATNRVFEGQPATVLASRVASRAARELPAEAVGPLALDEAVSAAAAATKGTTGSAVAGRADILIVPNLESGNILYKSLTLFAHAKVVGTCVGGKVPLVITSRSDSEETKLLSMALSCHLAGPS